MIENKEFIVKHKKTNDMVADILTKGLSKVKHYKCIKEMKLDV